ncbi:hypothetical protein J7T55_004584 [Diaporthe amygdali]|uniref:uncharacterized protein n=1 Tax=Phomopsis amygdali TaxID=1214568 RepID=UPI0022FE24DA|nr:uncharacterized protein J7T55_004584 [Diaporthe amygdali]KAJ0114842.1 hypothetical protein J7T55_004584 [Diaporthe amygdali]
MKTTVVDIMIMAATYAVGIILPIIVIIAAYRLLLHPLAGFPGPLPAKLTSAYTGFYAWRRCSHISTYRAFQKYGEITIAQRLSPQHASSGAEEEARTSNTSVTARPDRPDSPESSCLLHCHRTPWELHRNKRKTVGPAISERAMRFFEQDMSQEVDIFLALLLESSTKNEVVNMTPRCERLGVDVVGRLAFGFELKSQREPTHRHVAEGIKARSAISSIYMSWPSLRILNPVITWLSPRHRETDKENLYKSLRTMIGSRMVLPKEAKHDFYAQVSGEMGPDELWSEAILIVGAGGSTTATTMSAAFFYLSRNPLAYKCLCTEIRSRFSSAREISQGAQLSACSYLRAVIDESLRLSTGTISNWRIQAAPSIAAGEQLVVDGHVIAPGTEVATNAYSFMRNPDYYPEPLAFRPERWLEGNEEQRATMRRALIPFSLGSRSCAGQAMAYLELSLALARTFWYFDFEKAPGEAGGLSEVPGAPGEFKLEDSTIVGHSGPNLMFRTRADYWRELMATSSS